MPLAARPARAIVGAIADAAERWSDADFPPRVRALARVVERTGYAPEVVEYAFDRLFLPLRREPIAAVIADELGSLEVLDDFVPRKGLPSLRALPLGRVCVISSRTTVGVALIPALFALCAKCSVEVKDREDTLIASFFATLTEEMEEFADAARACAWAGGSAAVDLRAFDAVVAFGSTAGIAEIGAQLAATTRYVPHASATSAGYVAREALGDEPLAAALASQIARDVLLYDSEGCLSLHTLFVERGASVAPVRFAQVVAEALTRATVEFPAGRDDPPARARVASARDLARFRAASGSGSVFADGAANALVMLDPPFDESPAFLPRTLQIRSVDHPSQAAAYLRAHRLPIEAMAIAGARDDVVAMAIAAGTARLAHFGSMQAPPLGGRHGGRQRIGEFVRWASCDP